MRKRKFDFNFSLVLASQIISLFGGNIHRFALILFLVDFTQSPSLLGVITAISQLPVIFFAPLGGVLADRFNKKVLIVILDSMKALVAFTVFVLFITDTIAVWNVAILMTLSVTIMTFFSPVLTAAVPRIVDKEVLVEANGAMQTINGFAFLLGAASGGILMAAMGAQNLILICGIFFLASVFIDLFIKIPFEKREQTTGFLKTMVSDMKESWGFIRNENPTILKMALLFSVVVVLFQPIVVVGVPYVVRLLMGASEDLVGIAKALSGFGLIFGGLFAGKIKQWLHIGSFWKLMLLFGVSGPIFALAVHPAIIGGRLWLPFGLFSFTLLIVMSTATIVNIMVNVIIQKETPPNLIGKVGSLFGMVANIASPFGQVLFGVIIGATTGYLHWVFIGVGLIMLALAVFSKMVFKKEEEA